MSGGEFKLADTPLNQGVTFLEASAGTGKTYTISKLVVRLLVEEAMPISSILVMTFTEAATRELKDRIRLAILDTLAGLDNPKTEDRIAKKYQANDLSQIQDRLRMALATFDEAPIFTIHGFCHRVLNEFAFESNQLFEPTLIKEPTPLWKEAIEDYWRNEFYEGDGFVSTLLDWKSQTTDKLLSRLLVLNRHASLEVLPSTSDAEYEATVSELQEAWQTMAASFRSEGEAVLELLGTGEIFRQPLRGNIPDLVAVLKGSFPAKTNSQWLNAVATLDVEHLQQNLLKKHADTPLTPKFLSECNAFMAVAENLVHHHLFYCLRRVQKNLAATKQSENLLTFDDLLPALLQNLESGSGKRLQGIIQANYSAVLVDEFQDTDPQQTELFKRLFISPNQFLYFIGDPKQAIYKFRGADIFSYIAARELARNTFTLSKNWRSDPKLISAVNGIFFRPGNPFLFEAIAFQPSSAALPGGKFLCNNSPLDTPFKLCYLGSDNDKPVDNGAAKELIGKAMTSEILKLIGGSYLLNDNPVEPSDIAILTRSNWEAHSVRDELSANSIPSVIFSDQTVFETRDAKILQQLLNVLLEPKRLDWLRGLYATEWFDWSAEEIVNGNWSEVQEKMYELHLTWMKDGIVPALDEWIRWSKIKPLLLSRIGGERNATNLLHLIELLGQAEMESKLEPLPLLQWFVSSLTNPDRERDDFLTRLESDERAVQIVTIHKSKGLQYPIVFVPFAWNSVLNRPNEARFYHRAASHNKLVYDNRTHPDNEDIQQFNKESLSDAVRLLYVALTRAEHSCYLFWGDFKSQDSSSIGHLLGLGTLDGTPEHTTVASAIEALESLHLPGMEILEVETMTEQDSPNFRRFETAANLKTRTLSQAPHRGFSISSFSSLATGFKEAIEETLSEDEEETSTAVEPAEELTIFAMDRGRIAGNLIHDVLEQADFQNTQSILQATDSNGRESLLNDLWIPILQKHLTSLVSTTLPNQQAPFRLNQIPSSDCLKECEFHFPMRNTSTRELLQYFKSMAPKHFGNELPGVDCWDETRLSGYLRGFIDLLFKWKDRFYILDWKSNWLGNNAESYDEEAMNQAMGEHAYFLQYYLYTLAVVRFLQTRIPDFDYDTHFGGVYYLFVRGVSEEHPGSGVFFDRPAPENIRKLDELFQSPKLSLRS
jgi:exodeoxyribonuclease V beta subunit